ncbi:hypothetical protein EDB85DRAFT_2281285 [Lactarius pseudohatsudake]|nr:hypothetical protein EDB85DRAFT_2281285 [Lactarius pseudohatsudake]
MVRRKAFVRNLARVYCLFWPPADFSVRTVTRPLPDLHHFSVPWQEHIRHGWLYSIIVIRVNSHSVTIKISVRRMLVAPDRGKVAPNCPAKNKNRGCEALQGVAQTSARSRKRLDRRAKAARECGEVGKGNRVGWFDTCHLVLKLQKIKMAHAHGESNGHVATINILPDEILLEIFALCLPDFYGYLASIEHMGVWQSLVHVCQRWRRIICSSTRYLDLHLYRSSETSFRKNLSLWPEFPLAVKCFIPDDQDDFVAILEHLDRLTGPKYEGYNPDVLDIPDGFLGGSAPCLQYLCLERTSFPGLPTLLLLAHDLVSLHLCSVPPTDCDHGYISPEEMVGGLAGLTKLRTLSIDRYPFSTPSHEQRRRPDPPILAVLPALTEFVFGCDFEYLEDLVAQIDAPRVEDVRIQYLMEEVQICQLSQFIGRSNLKHAQFRLAKVTFYSWSVDIKLDLPQGECLQPEFHIKTSFVNATIASPVLYVVHVLGQLVAMTSNVGHLQVSFGFGAPTTTAGKYILEAEWLPLLHLFSSVEVLEVSGGLAGCIASALEDTAEETRTILLPELKLLWLADDNCNKPERFLSSRQLSGRPITIVDTQDEFVERLNAHWGCQEKAL